MIDLEEKYNFKTYIRRCHKASHTTIRLSSAVVNDLNVLLHILAKDIITTSIEYLKMTDHKTLSSNAIQSAIRTIMDGEIAKNAVSEGITAVGKYIKNKNNDKKTPKKVPTMFPISRVDKLIRHYYDNRVTATAPVYLANVLEYICVDILDQMINRAEEKRTKTISPKLFKIAIEKDNELRKLFKNVTIAAGVLAQGSYR